MVFESERQNIGIAQSERIIQVEAKQLSAIATSQVKVNSDLRLSYRKQKIMTQPKMATVIAESAMVADALTKVVLLSEDSDELESTKKVMFELKARGFHEAHAVF